MDINDVGSKYEIREFIKQIKNRPVLWNPKTEGYSDRNTKFENWMEIVEMFFDNPDGDDYDKCEYSRLLQTKWKNLRDTYNRHVNKKTLNRYKHYRDLQFLDVLYNVDSPPDLEYCGTPNTLRFSSRRREAMIKTYNTTKTKKTAASKKERVNSSDSDPFSKLDTEDTEFIDLDTGSRDTPKAASLPSVNNSFTKTNQSNSSESDCDRLFLLSLIEPMKEIPRSVRFKVKMEIMQIIENARTKNPF